MTLSQNICRTLSACGLEQKLVHSLVDEISKWHHHSGASWTVDRLKDLKRDYLLREFPHNGDGNQAIGDFKISIARRPDGRPKGPFGSLPNGNPRRVAQALLALSCYAKFLAGSVTKKQLRKFLDSVQASPDSTGYVSIVENIPRPSVVHWAGKSRTHLPHGAQLERNFEMNIRPFSEHSFGSARAPLTTGRTVSEDEVLEWLPDNCRLHAVRHAARVTLRKEFNALKIMSFCKGGNPIGNDRAASGGRISFIQEPGYKLRYIANPYRVWQMLLQPLKEAAFNSLKAIPEDCTYDQYSGVRRVQEWLKAGKTVFTYDLSDATSYFPLDWTLDALWPNASNDGLERQLAAFRYVSRASWRLPDANQVTWTRGQPLGLGPSFAMFALAHHSLVRGCGGGASDDYVILGDDIAMTGPNLAREYIKGMRSLGVPISKEKSMISNRLAEFAGHAITADTIYPSFKHREVSDRNFLEVARMLGPTSKGLFRPRQRKVLDILCEIPEFAGGLGWNPKGIPLEDRLEKARALQLWLTDPEVLLETENRLDRHNRLVNEAAYRKGTEWSSLDGTAGPSIPTRDTLARVNAQAGVSHGFKPEDKLSQDDVGTTRQTRDPRGPTPLEILERKLGKGGKTREPRIKRGSQLDSKRPGVNQGTSRKR